MEKKRNLITTERNIQTHALSPCLLALLFASLILFIGAGGRVVLDSSWNGKADIPIYDADVDGFVISESLYSWGDEESNGDIWEQPLRIELTTDPDDPTRSSLYFEREYAEEGYTGLAREYYYDHPLSLNTTDAISIRYRTDGPVSILLQIEESDSTPTWPPENWQRPLRINAPEWRVATIPLYSFRLNSEYQPYGQTGDEILNAEHIGKLMLSFPPEQALNLYVSHIYVDRAQFTWKLAAGLAMMSVWWLIIVFSILMAHQRQMWAGYHAELAKFCMYSVVLLIADSPYQMGYTFIILVFFSIAETLLRLCGDRSLRTIQLLDHASPWLAAGFIATMAPVLSLGPLWISAHCTHCLGYGEKRNALWSGAHFALASLLLIALAPNDAAALIIFLSAATLTGFYIFSTHYRKRTRLEEQHLAEQELFSQQIERSRQIQAVGRMAAGAAHQFNNLLTIIIGNINLAQIHAPESAQEKLRNAREAADQAAKLVQRLLFFSQQYSSRKKTIRVEKVIEEAKTLFMQSCKSNIFSFNLDIAPSIPHVDADPYYLRTVLLDMMINSRDAIEEAAKKHPEKDFRIQVSASIANRESIAQRRDEDELERDFVVITISDNGVGIGEKEKDLVFEPFFTTKDAQRGAGLGLPSAYGIIEEHGGWIEIESAPDQGAAFHIFLPGREENIDEVAASA